MFFQKKPNQKENELKVKYHPGYMQYVPVDDEGNQIPIEELTPQQADILKRKNYELKTNPELLQKAIATSRRTDRAKKLSEMGYDACSFEVLSTTRDVTSIAPEIRKWLDDIVAEEDVLIGIHRTGKAKLDEIAQILCWGLIINPKNKGAYATEIELGNTVSYYPNNEIIFKELLCADEWQNSLGSILIKIPDEELEGNIFMIDSEDGTHYLNPQYIIGFVPLGPGGKVTEVIASNYYGGQEPFVKPLESIYDDRAYASTSSNQSTNSDVKK